LIFQEGWRTWPNKRIGIVYGKFMLLLKQNTFFGGFVGVVYQRVADYKKGMSIVR
jgi:hypothetical protein